MAVTRSTIESVLKEAYIDPIVDQFNTKKLLMKLIRRNRRDFGGDGAYIPVLESRTHSYGARPEGGTLPAAAASAYDNMFVNAKFNYAKLALTGPSMSIARKSEYAFVRTLNAAVSTTTEGFTSDFNRQLWGSGGCILGLCGVSTATTTITMSTTDKDGGWGTQFIENGMLVDIRVESSGASLVTSRTVSAVDHSAGTFVISGAATTTSGVHVVTIAGTRDDTGGGVGRCHEVMGIHGIVNDQDPDTLSGGADGGNGLQAKAIASNTWHKSARVHASGTNRDVSESLLFDLMIKIDKTSGLGNEIDLLVSSHEIWKEFGLELLRDRRYGGKPEMLEGGFKYLDFNGTKWFFDKHCQPNRVFALNLEHLTLYEESDVRWDETDGSLLKWDGSTDGFEAWLEYYSNLGTDRRSAHGVLEDLKQTTITPTF